VLDNSVLLAKGTEGVGAGLDYFQTQKKGFRPFLNQ